MLTTLTPDLRVLHRSFTQQIKSLPTNYLRQFFRIKVGDDLRVLASSSGSNHKNKTKRVVKELRKLTAANQGNAKAFQHVLDTAYGRKGKLRWELVQPLLSNPSAPLPDRIIPSVESSRPPGFSPELTALLGSTHAHLTRPVTAAAIETPPNLPERANPNSEEARLLGPFSKRREVNLRWRFWKEELRKLLPTLHVSVEQKDKTYAVIESSVHNTALAKAGIRGFGFQGTNVLGEIIDIAGSPYKPPSLPTSSKLESSPSRPITNRFIRRRYQELLGRTPILTYSYRKLDEEIKPVGYTVSLAPGAISSELRYNSSRIATADDTDLKWIAASPVQKAKGKK